MNVVVYSYDFGFSADSSSNLVEGRLACGEAGGACLGCFCLGLRDRNVESLNFAQCFQLGSKFLGLPNCDDRKFFGLDVIFCHAKDIGGTNLLHGVFVLVDEVGWVTVILVSHHPAECLGGGIEIENKAVCDTLLGRFQLSRTN